MPGRIFNSGDYRFGFNSYENDNEVKGIANHLNFDGYGYDPRLIRRWNIDPKSVVAPNYSPYTFAGNNPILLVDVDGEHKMVYIFLDFSTLNLSATEENELIDKLHKVVARVNGSNQMEIELDFAITDRIINYSDLDQTDVMVTVEDPDQLNQRMKVPKYSPLTDLSIGQGSTPSKAFPVAVYPTSLKKPREYSLGRTEEYLPNKIDVLAYVIIHEAFHRIAQNFKFTIGDGDHDLKPVGGLMDEGSPRMKDNTIESASDKIYRLSEERINEMEKYIGKWDIIWGVPFGWSEPPKDNASKKSGAKVRGRKGKDEPRILFNPRY